MRIPMKVDYGVRALVDLALRANAGPALTAEIAARQGIPEQFLEQLLPSLSRSGLVRSRRGPHGGHVLARPPGTITLDGVFAVLDGTNHVLDCLDEPDECDLAGVCAQRNMWRSVEEAVRAVLRSTTIADLAEQQRHPVALELQRA